MSDYQVVVSDLKKTYRLGKVDYPALQGVNLNVRKGEFLAIIGPSGCGKTTLLNLIGGLDRPTQGGVLVDGVQLNEMSESGLAEFRSKKVGFIFQFYNLIPTLTASENVELPLSIAKFSKADASARSRELLQMVGLLGKEGKKPYELSGGEQQRVAIARALSNHPSIILADEPTGNLDLKTGSEIIKMLATFNRNMDQTLICATHSQDIIEHASRTIMLRDGVVVKEMV